MTKVVMIKGEEPRDDRTWLATEVGQFRRVAVHVVHDLPHLVVESLFGLEDGLWGTLAVGGFSTANRTVGLRQGRRARLVTDVPLDEVAQRRWVGHRVAKTATNAVMNRWGDGENSAAGVRQRLRGAAAESADTDPGYAARIQALENGLDDGVIEQAILMTRQLSRRWSGLRPGGRLTLQWPLSPDE